MQISKFWLATFAMTLALSVQQRYVPPNEQLVVELFVRDLDRSIAFYRDIGFELIRRDDEFAELSWEEHLFFLDSSRPRRISTPQPPTFASWCPT